MTPVRLNVIGPGVYRLTPEAPEAKARTVFGTDRAIVTLAALEAVGYDVQVAKQALIEEVQRRMAEVKSPEVVRVNA